VDAWNLHSCGELSETRRSGTIRDSTPDPRASIWWSLLVTDVQKLARMLSGGALIQVPPCRVLLTDLVVEYWNRGPN